MALWGTGNPKREFLYVNDVADACIYLFENLEADDLYSRGVSHINIGTGIDITISELAEMIKIFLGFSGTIEWDPSKPDGTQRKLLDVDKLKQMGWEPAYSLKKGLEETYRQYANKSEIWVEIL